ncbi:MAG: YqeG family HAD IIIA-type phosphatase [Mycoplasmatales bacterium]
MKKFEPTVYVNNVFDIDIAQLKKNGIKMLCFDLDNTLDKPNNMTQAMNDDMQKLLNNLQEYFEVMIVSNNMIKGRVASFATVYNLNYIEAMKKPFKKNYQHQNILKYNKEEVIFIGDKIVTDVLGANRLGYKSILVDPLYPKSNKWYNKIMSLFDEIILKLSTVKKKEYFNNLEQNEN